MNPEIKIDTDRFVLRPLTASDVSPRYLGWLIDQETKKFISSAAATRDLTDLTRYVAQRVGRDDVLFLGIFAKPDGVHVGNIKYEPVNSTLGYAIMGILIGDPAYRGQGVTAEVLRASADWLRQYRHIRQIVLGVRKDNGPAIRAYEKAGFVVATTSYIVSTPQTLTMVWSI